ncbi:hypothetical protein [Salarchaeum sp. JOR-1]|uniref:hypothetical protein n=1 Tax=Salarchaeum sp. JOR-1 TaxID=2599399 RepID=UPI001198BC66|nr:hypothetical protein [Salarchaeum sp. JOR-1]QDX41703.1 hypothetical protein FQU85_12595 [Salarchaeum sp. JOR-1]
MSDDASLSCHAKLARVVLANRGPLSPSEIAAEARISESDAATAMDELVEAGRAECVCGVCETREQVYALLEEAKA